ncbi:MAG: type I restriction-modification system subunit M [Bacteroidales bacterium]|nr:type I restriction-modification system subunit M [Bacteroidales bacterium]MCF8344139.1 type I restriction-modification system subunit M [Bacteroidales bacterium]MCF8350080.1 type I restriction-modification system subunit M [Bacteroidales bacterium]MCF8374976.1 type I restriction-modification system subunit M [Bacteroidales bacterium]MCF8402130.1 type I restriction-modification system subunit M [Bacteroidales bacterium]
MTTETHTQMVSFIWDICNLLRGPYKRNEYRRVILPMTVLRRFDCILEPTKENALEQYEKYKGRSENILRNKMYEVTGVPFYNTSKLNFGKLKDDPNQIAPNLNSYINAFSPNIREIFEKFEFGDEVSKMSAKNLLYEVVKKFNSIDLNPERIDNLQMGYIFEELIRIGAEQSNEEAGHHYTPREVIRLMVNLLLSPEEDLAESFKVKTIYDPACGTGGMLSEAERYIMELNKDAQPVLYGQDYNDEAWAICKSDMLIKGEEADNIKLDNSFTDDGFPDEKFDYMLANPPFGVSWKQEEKYIKNEAGRMGYGGRFGTGLPRVNDGALLFLQHMISKMRKPDHEGSRISIVFNGSPLFTGDAGSGESEIRRWIIENDWLEAIVALPDQLFYNTGISTYVWIVCNRKEDKRKGKIQLIDARQFYVKMRKSLGNKRNQVGDGREGRPDQIAEITAIYDNFRHDENRKFIIDGKEKELIVSKVFDNEDFGYHKVTVERPLRLNFIANAERIALLDAQSAFEKLASSKKKNEEIKQQEIEAGKKRQLKIRELLEALGKHCNEKLYKDRKEFLKDLKKLDKEHNVRLNAAETKAIIAALGERDETAEICRDSKGNPEPDPDLRDTEIIPLKENIEVYFTREVLPYVPDAWIDHSKTKVGYEIPLNRHFYKYEPPRDLEVIEQEMKALESDILDMLHQVTNGKGIDG